MAQAPNPNRQGGRGFTLLEVLLAFVIAVPALLTLSWTGIDALAALQRTARTEDALARARSRLTLALHAAPLVPGISSGDDGGGFRWRVQVRPVDGPALQPLASRGPNRLLRVQNTLHAISVEVTWDTGAVQLETLRLVSRLLPREAAGEAWR